MDIMNIPFENTKGETKTLKDYPGKAYLIVNTASKCGLTPHYEGLQKVHEKYEGRGLIVLGFPANDFLAQEPGSDAEIQEFCQVNFGVNFPILKKISVKGDQKHLLYQSLLAQNIAPLKKTGNGFENRLRENNLLTGEGTNQIHWNFEKFLLNDKGEIEARFFPDYDAQDPEVIKAIEEVLS